MCCQNFGTLPDCVTVPLAQITLAGMGAEDRLNVARDHVIEVLKIVEVGIGVVDRVKVLRTEDAARMLDLLRQYLEIAERHLKIIEAIVAERQVAAIEERLDAIGKGARQADNQE